MSLEPRFPGRDPKAGTDEQLDTMFERALSVREFALAYGFPLPQPERCKWRRCVLVILGALLATLLLGRLLESLRIAQQRPVAANADVSTIAALFTVSEHKSDHAEPEDSSVAASGPVLKDPFADWAPKAVLIRLPRTSAPRAELVALPVRRAELINPSTSHAN